nr:hypothetical protein B0A51_12813 [Rachicladosporium sp. CCFEE 5018]
MATRIDDRWLWLGASITLFLMAHGIRHAIHDILRLTEVTDDWDTNIEAKQETVENSIPVSTLKTLHSSPNVNISEAATALIIARYRQSPQTREAIRRDAASMDEGTAFRAKRTLSFIRDWEVTHDCGIKSADPTPAGSGTDEGDDEGDQGAAAVFAGWDAVPRPLQADQTSQDMETRRRRRNAWIHHEVEDGSIDADDIFQPNSSR